MKRKLLSIIAVSFILSILSATPANADFCGPSFKSSEFNFYKTAYCSGVRSTGADDDIYEIIAEQFGIDNEDTVEKILNLEQFDYLKELPPALRDRYGISTSNQDRAKIPLTLDVQAAYE